MANALARKFGWRIRPDGATAQNLLGLSTQVPSKSVYLSDGPSRTYSLGNRTLSFEKTALKEAVFKLPQSRIVVQALKSLGEDRITSDVVTHIRNQFDSTLRRKLLLDTKTATGWVYAVIQEIAEQPKNG
ncbi:hypothetical protein F183_A21120 [Bryobacterales bacterium F-183]|nr:hypothetical protein F183_A21120 [Bryobacterales bacterium F-183]